MANKKFSEFTLKTDSANVDFLVGFEGTDNVRIAPSNLSSGGASSLNGLSDVLIDGTSAYFINIPSGLSGNPADNLVIGNLAGNALTTGSDNVALGFKALSSGTIAQQNVAIGSEAFLSVTGNNNVAVGFEAGKISTSANSCTFIGHSAGNQNTFGDANTFVGKGAGFWNNTLSDNTYVGQNAGTVLGQKNASLGSRSLNGTFAAVSESVGVGYAAGRNNQATQVTFVGTEAGRSNTAAGHISIGYEAGYSNTSAAETTNIGYQAGYSNTTSGWRTMFGYQAGKNNTGAFNVFMGARAVSSGTGNGMQNVMIGYEAGKTLTNGSRNTAVGNQSMTAPSASEDNVAIGHEALKASGSKYYNTAVGSKAGDSVTTGQNLTIIGYDADASSATATNEITLGNASIGTLRCQVQTISALSDSRDKTNIQPSTYGLDLISQLNPVTFDWNMRDGAKVGQKDLGFIAQELQELDDENLQLVYDNNPDRLEASYGRLIPVLVQAIKELKAEVELLKA